MVLEELMRSRALANGIMHILNVIPYSGGDALYVTTVSACPKISASEPSPFSLAALQDIRKSDKVA
jgi:hypothetical protein